MPSCHHASTSTKQQPATAAEAVRNLFPRSTYVERHAETIANVGRAGGAALRTYFFGVVFIDRNADKLAAAVAAFNGSAER